MTVLFTWLLCFVRWFCAALCVATIAAIGCASPTTAVPIQTGPGHQETQQGGIRTTVPLHIAPVINPAPAAKTSQPTTGGP